MKENVTRMTSRRLVKIIAFTNTDVRYETTVPAGEIAAIVVGKWRVRQKAIEVLRSRMKRHYNLNIIGEMAMRVPKFAKIFCEKHLKCPAIAQFCLDLGA